MFKFISANSVIIDEIIYVLCGLVCIMTGVRGLKKKRLLLELFFSGPYLVFCSAQASF